MGQANELLQKCNIKLNELVLKLFDINRIGCVGMIVKRSIPQNKRNVSPPSHNSSCVVYFGRQAQRSLEMWLEIRPDIGGQVFIGTKGNGWSEKPFSPSGIYHAWRGWQEAAGIGPYKFHEIRHSHVTHSLNNGVPIHHVSKQVGHKSPDITLRVYFHIQHNITIAP